MAIKPENNEDEPTFFEPIDYEEILKMVGHYREDLREGDTTSAWVSIYQLMSLISDNKANGIRIYFGRHAEDDKFFPGQHNLIFVATRDVKNPENPTTENSVDLLDKNKKAAGLAEGSVSYAGLGAEKIPLCPPHCPTTPI